MTGGDITFSGPDDMGDKAIIAVTSLQKYPNILNLCVINLIGNTYIIWYMIGMAYHNHHIDKSKRERLSPYFSLSAIATTTQHGVNSALGMSYKAWFTLSIENISGIKIT